jgi:hypothetical protein
VPPGLHTVYAYATYGDEGTPESSDVGTGNSPEIGNVKAFPFVRLPIVPLINWPAAAPIMAGTALSNSQLNATASVPGTFAYTPALGAVLSPGVQTLSVTFTPTDTTDYADAMQTVSLAVQDFGLPATAPTVTITRGQSGTASISVSSAYGGFAGTVSFTCSVPSTMSEASCSASSVQVPASSAANSTLTVTTAGPHQVASIAKPGWMASSFGVMFAGIVLLGVPQTRRRRSGLLTLLLLLVLCFAVVSCGGGGGGSTGGGRTDPGTPAGTYSLNLTATSGTASHTMNVSVTVQ